MSFLSQMGEALKEQVLCPLLQANTALNSSLRDLIELSTGYRPPSLEPLGAYQLTVCQLPESPPQIPQPFEGGQCPVYYLVAARYTYEFLNLDGTWEPLEGSSSAIRVLGAIENIFVEKVFSIDGSPCDNNAILFNLVVVGQDGVQSTLIDREYNCGSFIGAIRNIVVQRYDIDREDGLPDTCGNPPPADEPPPIPPEGTEPFPFSFPITINEGGSPITIDVGGVAIILPPRIGVNADINIPISANIDIGGISFSPTINLDFNIAEGAFKVEPGAFPISFGGIVINNSPPPWNSPPGGLPPGTGAPRPLPGSTPPPSPPDAPDPPEKRPPSGERVIIGALVTTTSVASWQRATVIGQGDNPDIYAPDLGHINFLCRLGTGTTGGWTPDQKVKNRRCLIPCEWKYGAIEVKGTPQPGVTWTITPIYDVVASPNNQTRNS